MSAPTHFAHDATVVAQFTQQAIPFATLPAHLDAIDTIVAMSGVGADDWVLDVACGPGLVASAFAQVAWQVTGIDLTPEMIAQARHRQEVEGIRNMRFNTGSAMELPYDDDSFEVVVSRYSFHHLLDPATALAEMCRVCVPGGRVVIADVCMSVHSVDAFNAMERRRDPSHVAALSEPAWQDLLRASGLRDLRRADYRVDVELDLQMLSSFPEPGGDEAVRAMVQADIGRDALGIDARWVGDEIHYSYPIAVFAGIC